MGKYNKMIMPVFVEHLLNKLEGKLGNRFYNLVDQGLGSSDFWVV